MRDALWLGILPLCLHLLLCPQQGCDPMLATGGSALTAIKVLTDAGVREQDILFINVVSCPEGLRALAEKALPEAAMVERLTFISNAEGVDIAPDALSELMRLTEGDMRRAIQLLQSLHQLHGGKTTSKQASKQHEHLAAPLQ